MPVSSSLISFSSARGGVGALVCVLLALLLAGPGRAASPEPELVLNRVLVQGLDAEREAELRAGLGLAAGASLAPERLRALQVRLGGLGMQPTRLRLAQPGFSAEYEPGRVMAVDLILDYRPAPRVESVRFFSLFPDAPVPDTDALPLGPGERYDREKVQEIAQLLTEQARGQGYRDLVVTPFEFPLSSGTLELGFILERAAHPVALKKVHFRGSGFLDLLNRSGLAATLGKLETLPFEEGSAVTAARLLEVARIGEAYYQEKGFLDARVGLDEVEALEDGRTVQVHYRVQRGAAYEIGTTRFEGAGQVEDAALERAADWHEGRRFQGKRYRALLEELERICMRAGFMAPDIRIELDKHPDTEQVDLLAHIDEGGKSRLGRVILIHHALQDPPRNPDNPFHRFRLWTSPPLADHVILRQVRTEPGEALDLWSIEDPARRLEAFGFLEEVDVSTRPTSDSLVRDIVVELRDKRSGALSATGGWSTQRQGYAGSFQLHEANLGGVGDGLSFQVEAAQDRLGLMLSYLDRNWKLGERLLGEEREPSLMHSLYLGEDWFREYTQETKGVAWELGFRPLERRSPWLHGLRLRIEDVGLEPRQDPEEYEERFDDYLTAALGYRIFQDTRNRGDLSTAGAFYGAGVEAGVADGPLLKFTSHYERYSTFLKRLTWRTRAEFGLMPFEADTVGISERFQGGGARDLRGYRWRGLGPVDAKEELLHVGGSTRLLLSNELRYAITRNLVPLVFLDVGSLDDSPLGFGNWNASAGVGVRFILPGMNNEIFASYARSLIDRDTDELESIQFGAQFALN